MVGDIRILGILNLTPDSFYAASRSTAGEVAMRARKLLEEGADMVDLGACSTRPGAPQPSLEEEWRRLEPALKHILRFAQNDKQEDQNDRQEDQNDRQEALFHCHSEAEGRRIYFSIDTYRAEIVRRVFDTVGPFLVNDISAGQMDPEMLQTVGSLGLPYIAMHMRGTPETMQRFTDYPEGVVAAVKAYFQTFALKADSAGIREWILDPGFGFSKTLEQNYQLLEGLGELVELNRPILAGLSRKSMVYKALGISPEEAMPATQVVQFAALERGARWLRVHDVAAAVQTARLYSTMYTSSPGAAK
jgi:dihydropteroate synthase